MWLQYKVRSGVYEFHLTPTGKNHKANKNNFEQLIFLATLIGKQIFCYWYIYGLVSFTLKSHYSSGGFYWMKNSYLCAMNLFSAPH